MREGSTRVFDSASLLPAPQSEFGGYDDTEPDAETYIRRMHWGAFQVVMENVPRAPNLPWQPEYPPLVLQTYQYYSTLHWELAPYLHSYDELAYRTGAPIYRDDDSATYTTQLGAEILVRYVT